jgi:uncharacterized protein (TIGR02646 family)
MKRIIKTNAPTELLSWIDKQKKGDLSYPYGDMPSNVRAAVKKCLLKEQGYICCYTGKEIDEDSSHFEHLKPQSLCQNNEDVEYRNLLAAYPGPSYSSENKQQCPYGAHARTNDEFPITPLDLKCERAFKFDELGQINACSEDAKTTIDVLKLDEDSLTELRAAAISEFFETTEYTSEKLRKALAEICKRRSDDSFREYCFVLEQVGSKYYLPHLEKKEK